VVERGHIANTFSGGVPQNGQHVLLCKILIYPELETVRVTVVVAAGSLMPVFSVAVKKSMSSTPSVNWEVFRAVEDRSLTALNALNAFRCPPVLQMPLEHSPRVLVVGIQPSGSTDRKRFNWEVR
jgi:hypothetical protein